MSAKISKKEVENVAALSRLYLDEETKEIMQVQLSRILDFMKKLDEVDTSNVEPTSHILDLVNVVREDEIRESLPVDVITKLAPKKKDNFIVVPRVI
jgi:aspartyl-tRNA(Asn)/glutamyl-tRNA(Gln) amidotransferase subunit C